MLWEAYNVQRCILAMNNEYQGYFHVEMFVDFVLKSIIQKLKLRNYSRFNVTTKLYENYEIFKWVVRMKICTNELLAIWYVR